MNWLFAIWIPLILFAVPAMAQSCPGEDDDPAFLVKTTAGPSLFLCGFEDREVKAAKGKRSYTDFDIYFVTEASKEPHKVFSGESSETYWAKAIPGKGIELEELWFFSEEPRAALQSMVSCTAEACKVSEEKCIFKMKRNPFPKALAEFKKKSAAGKITDEGEELIDQIFAQALTGDKAAKEFYSSEPKGLDPALKEVFTTNQSKLKLGCKP